MAQIESEQLLETKAEVQRLIAIFEKANERENNRGKRDKYENACKELKNSTLPMIELNRAVFYGKNESGMRQQFKRVCEEKGFPAYSCVWLGDGEDAQRLLVDFTNPNAAEAFDAYVQQKAGITLSELLGLTHELDSATS